MQHIKELTRTTADNILVDAMGIPTGFPQLDQVLRGLTRGELTLIAGRSSMGKTSLMIDMALNIASTESVCVFSLEMSARQLIERMIVNKQNCSLYDLKEGRVKIDENTVEFIEKLNLYIDDNSSFSVLDINRAINNLGCVPSVVFIDYLQLIRPHNGKNTRYVEVDEICQYLRSIAKSKNICVALLCQLNREVERRENHRPRLSDLRESGGIEQTADKIIMLYRPAYYSLYEESNEKAEDDGEGHIIVAKNRNGSLGDIPVVWLAEQMSYRPCNFKLGDEF